MSGWAARSGPLTAAQRQLWALHRRTPLPQALNLSYALDIEGPLDAAALDEAFRALVRSHEPLRTTYEERGGEVVAVVGDTALGTRHLDLTPVPVDEAEAAARAARDRRLPLDPATEPPLRASLLRLGEERHVLLLTLHHIAGDGWSLYLLNKEVSRDYAALLRGRPVEPGGHRLECLELAEAQRAWLAGPEAEEETRWWLERLRTAAPRPPLPWSAGADEGAALARQALALPDDLAQAARKLAREAGVSLYVVLLTAFEVLLERWTGCAETVVGTLAANRQTLDGAGVMGAHYNPLLLTTDVTGDPSLSECLLRTAGRTVAALDRQALPFAVLAERLAEERGWPAGSVPSVMFLMDRYPVEGLRLAGCRVTGTHVDESTGPVASVPAATTADLTFFVREAGDRLTLSALYPPGRGRDGSVVAALHRYPEILAALCEEPERPVSDLTSPLDDDTPPPGRESRPGGPTLRKITELAPVDALSPVGSWAPPAGNLEAGP